jgi:outer membrane protein assembly factor BamB
MRIRSGLLWLSLLAAARLPIAAQPNLLTYHNDAARTGQNLLETTLTPSNVNATAFGKLFQVTLDGSVDAQPLYVAGVPIPNQGTHNVLIAATENDSLYALDADTGAQLWQVALLPTGETPSDNRGCGQVTPEIGITSTPVIALETGTGLGVIFAVAMSKDSSGNYYQRLYKVSLAAGKPLAAVVIGGKYPGTGDNSSGGYVYFESSQYKERSGLLLLGGVVYLAWASHCDAQPYTGWIMGYNATTLAQTSVIDVTPNGAEGAIWGAGGGLAADSSGYIYFLDANGTFDTTLNAQGFPVNGDYGNAFIKLSAAGGQLTVADYFTMYNTTSESDADEDLGSGAALVLPKMIDATGQVQQLAIGAGKDGNIYLVNRANMGKFNPQNDSAIYQELDGALSGGIWSMPAYYHGQVYFGEVGGPIQAFQFSKAMLLPAPVSATGTTFPYPGATPSISANGAANGILWAVENNSPAVLHAYLATNLAQELYNTSQAPNGRDQFGAGNKFMVPAIVNGKVYVGTPNGVAAFGLLNPPASIARRKARTDRH